MSLFDKEFNEILSGQIVSLIGGLIAGILLAVYTDNILLIPAMFILIPGFLELRGNISGSLSARLSSGLFLGVIKPKINSDYLLVGNVIASFILTLAISALLGSLAFLIEYLIFGILFVKIIYIAIIAGLLANIISIPFSVYFTFYLFRKGHDPNNVMGPFLTALGDVVSMLSLLAAVVLV
ncbi:magnesium transporter [Candidatus Woesearchaeota archaeon]|nr:magnesium transporter [Candidatus Woesearchaeota archaeon]